MSSKSSNLSSAPQSCIYRENFQDLRLVVSILVLCLQKSLLSRFFLTKYPVQRRLLYKPNTAPVISRIDLIYIYLDKSFHLGEDSQVNIVDENDYKNNIE